MQRRLRYFVTIAEEGHITRAAKKLHVAQPALSELIAKLEAELGLTLLERHARGVTLTPAGEKFYEKARLAVAAEMDAVQTARALARAQKGMIEFGFVGIPPGIDSPAMAASFVQQHPDIDVYFRELRFPSAPTSSWLGEVDVAVCHLPLEDPNVWTLPVRSEPRVVLAPARHPLAKRRTLTVAEVIDETFVGLHPSVEPMWAGFWNLEDCRNGSPRRVTEDHAVSPQEVLASLAARRAITTAPASVAQSIANAGSGVVAIPLRDASPATIALVGHQHARGPHVDSLVDFMRDPRHHEHFTKNKQIPKPA